MSFAEAGTSVGCLSAGLPNIIGSIRAGGNSAWAIADSALGAFAFFPRGLITGTVYNESGSPLPIDADKLLRFNASESSPIYGNAPIVQPFTITLVPQLRY